MLLKITITHFDGDHQDVLNHAGLSLEAARQRRDDLLKAMQQCILDRKIFYAGDDVDTVAIGPDLLARAHFKCQIIEEEAKRK